MKTHEYLVELVRAGLKFKCPSCNRAFKPIPFMLYATGIYHRTCQNPKCREQWQIKVTPKEIKGGWMHIGDFVFIARAK